LIFIPLGSSQGRKREGERGEEKIATQSFREGKRERGGVLTTRREGGKGKGTACSIPLVPKGKEKGKKN